MRIEFLTVAMPAPLVALRTTQVNKYYSSDDLRKLLLAVMETEK